MIGDFGVFWGFKLRYWGFGVLFGIFCDFRWVLGIWVVFEWFGFMVLCAPAVCWDGVLTCFCGFGFCFGCGSSGFEGCAWVFDFCGFADLFWYGFWCLNFLVFGLLFVGLMFVQCVRCCWCGLGVFAFGLIAWLVCGWVGVCCYGGFCVWVVWCVCCLGLRALFGCFV